MRKIKLFFILVIGLSLLTFVFPSSSQADCQIASFETNSRNLTVCAGGFTSITDVKRTSAEIKCLANSNSGSFTYTICRDVDKSIYNLSNTPDSQITKDSSGKYFTCFTAQGINRAIGKLEVKFTGGIDCTTTTQNTIPADWDVKSEGLPWQSGTNEPTKAGSPFCPDGTSISTAIGCIAAGDPKAMISQLLGWGTIVGGGIAFLMIVLAGLQIVMAGGDPKKVQAAKELITSAISGLILIIFSVILLNVIGVKILGLKSLGFSL